MINVAIIGAGIGAQHLNALSTLPNDFNILYLIDRDTDKAERAIGTLPVRVSPDLNTALQDPDVDLVDVCLPPYLHLQFTLSCLAAGKHVVCEKPLTTSLADAERVRGAAQDANKKVFPVFQYRWGPPLQQLEQLIAAGLTGAPMVAALETHWSRDASYYAEDWRGTWAGEQGGAVLCHAIHSHDLLCHFFGPVAAVSACTTTRANAIETEDCAAISFEMANGAIATSSITLGAARNETRLRFVFDHLTATSGLNPYLPGDTPWSFEARNPSQQSEVDTFVSKCRSKAVGFGGFFLEIAKNLNGFQSTAVTLDAGVRSIELVTAIYHSARSRERVALPISEEHPLYGGWAP